MAYNLATMGLKHTVVYYTAVMNEYCLNLGISRKD